MKSEDIIRMARETGIKIREYYDEGGSTPEELKRFAALVAAAEREACALVCEAIPFTHTRMDYDETCLECAKAIRARGGDV